MGKCKIREIPLDAGRYKIKCPYAMAPDCIVVHNTANDASAENEIRYMQRNDAYTSFHFAVDDKGAVQGLPLDRNGWHASDGENGHGNRYGIAIEICYSKSGGARFIKAEKNAAALIASLLTARGWNLSAVKTHRDFAPDKKYCPHRTLDMGWQRFLNMIYAELAVGKSLPDVYSHDGITFIRANNPRVVYWGGAKNDYKGAANYCNAGFFANFTDNGKPFTLPVANVRADIGAVSAAEQKYLMRHISGGKLTYTCAANSPPQFKSGKRPSTLIIPENGKPYVMDAADIPPGTKYALSGVPTVRNGDDVDYYNYVQPQGWDGSCMYATYRNWIGIRDGEIWIITGKTKTANYIYGMEFWGKVGAEGFTDIIALDGGGSYYLRCGNKVYPGSWGSRQISTVFCWE